MEFRCCSPAAVHRASSGWWRTCWGERHWWWWRWWASPARPFSPLASWPGSRWRAWRSPRSRRPAGGTSGCARCSGTRRCCWGGSPTSCCNTNTERSETHGWMERDRGWRGYWEGEERQTLSTYRGEAECINIQRIDSIYRGIRVGRGIRL